MSDHEMSITEIFESMEYGPAVVGDSAATQWLDRHDRYFGPCIGGRWTGTARESDIEVLSPVTGENLARVRRGDIDDVAAAVHAATEALPAWRALGGQRRARFLHEISGRIQEKSALFATLESLETGKPIRLTSDLGPRAATRYLYHYAGRAELLELDLSGYRSVGVCGQIISTGFPLLQLVRMVAPALAAGNTVILRPSESAPLTALLFADLCREAELPPGVVNIVTGDYLAEGAIVRHPKIPVITFAGPLEIGREVRAATAGSGKSIRLVGPGTTVFIIFETADLDSAIEGMVELALLDQGEDVTGYQLLVQEAIADRFLARLQGRLKALRSGDPLDRNIDLSVMLGPIESFARPDLTGARTPVTTFRTPEEAVEMVNDTRDISVASIWTEEIDTALESARRIRAGTTWINSIDTVEIAAGSGGFHNRGAGGEEGREEILAYLRPEWEEAPSATALIEIGDNLPGDGAVDRAVRVPGDGGARMIRRAIDTARWAGGWAECSARDRARILYGIAEELEAHTDELVTRILDQAGSTGATARHEVELSIRRLSTYAARVDGGWGEMARREPAGGLTLTIPAPLGIIGLLTPDDPSLLGFISTVAPAIALGNQVLVVPSGRAPAVTGILDQILESSGLPPGVVNIVAGERDELARFLAAETDLDSLWYFGPRAGAATVERLSTGNKRVWISDGAQRDWLDPVQSAGPEFLSQAVYFKNISIPYGR
jgi:aldehyde dehydrogenase (NAD+)